MKRDLVTEILKEKQISERGLRVTLSRIKKRYDLKSINQAACLYIKKQGLDINVSSIIDDITRQILLINHKPNALRVVQQSGSPEKSKIELVPKIKWMPLGHYAIARRLSEFYGYIFIFENALRIKIDTIMSSKYTNWWDTKIKNELHDVYKYSDDEKNNQSKLPMVGTSNLLQPIDYLTIGHLELIITKYQMLFIPSVFPSLNFFTGHMIIVKRVRNALAHMAPSISAKDIRNAKNEIDILLQHLSTIH